MQAYAEGYELLEKADLVDDVTGGPRLLARGHGRPVLAARPAGHRRSRTTPACPDPRLRRGLRRGPLDGRGRHRPRRPAPRHRRVAVRPLRLPAGRVAGHAGRRRHAPAVRRPRRAGCREGRDTTARTPRSARRTARAARLPVVSREAELDLEPGPTAFIGANGQGKTNLVEAIDYVARLDSHRVAGDAPLVRAGAEQAVVRASRSSATTARRCSRSRSRRARQPGPRQPVAAAPHPRHHRHPAHRHVLAGGPRAGQGRPVRPPALPRRAADAAHAAAGRRQGRLRPRAQAAQHAAEVGARAAAARSICRPSTSGTTSWPRWAASSSRSGSTLLADLAPLWRGLPRRSRPRRRPIAATSPRPTSRRSSCGRRRRRPGDGPHGAAGRHRAAGGATSSSAASLSSARIATTSILDDRRPPGQGLREPRRVLVARAGAAARVVRRCCATRATTRCSSSTTSSPSSTRAAASSSPARRRRRAGAGHRPRWPTTCPSRCSGRRFRVEGRASAA